MNRQDEIQLAQLLEERRRDLETLLAENENIAESIGYSFGQQLAAIQTLAGQLPAYTDTAAALGYLATAARHLDKIAGALTRAAAQLRSDNPHAIKLRWIAEVVEREAAIARGHASDLRNYQRPDGPGHNDYMELHIDAIRYWINELTDDARNASARGDTAAAAYTLAASLLKEAQKAARAHVNALETRRALAAAAAKAEELAQQEAQETAWQPVCNVCGRPFTDEEWTDRHDGPDGEDIHAECCAQCNAEDAAEADRPLPVLDSDLDSWMNETNATPGQEA